MTSDYDRFIDGLPIMECKDPKKMGIRRMHKRRASKALIDALEKGTWLEDGTSDVLPDSEFFGTFWWQTVHDAVLYRDDYTCTICGKTRDEGAKLHVHHIMYRCKGGSDNPLNLRTVCEDCHKEIHRMDHIKKV